MRRGVDQELVLEGDGQTYSWSDGKEAVLPGGATITAIRGGWRDQDGRVRVIFYPNGGSSGVSLIVGQGDGDSLRFTLRVDPMLGSVIIQHPFQTAGRFSMKAAMPSCASA